MLSLSLWAAAGFCFKDKGPERERVPGAGGEREREAFVLVVVALLISAHGLSSPFSFLEKIHRRDFSFSRSSLLFIYLFHLDFEKIVAFNPSGRPSLNVWHRITGLPVFD